MKTARRLTFVTISLGTLALLLGYAHDGQWPWVAAVAGTGLGWAASAWLGREWPETLAFVATVGLAARGVVQSLPTGWMVVAVVAGLSAWTLGHFARRMASAPQVQDADRLARRFLLRLLAVDALSLAVAALALLIDIRLTFLPALTLGVLLFLGLTRLVSALRRET